MWHSPLVRGNASDDLGTTPAVSITLHANWRQKSTWRPHFRLLDRMPCRVHDDGSQLKGEPEVFRFYTIRTRENGELLWDVSNSQPREPTAAQLSRYHALVREGNVTCFSREECLHPINFYEQSHVCSFCGSERFCTTNKNIAVKTGT